MKWIFLSLVALLSLVTHAAPAKGAPRVARNSDGKVFVHPGIFYTQGDIDRMKAMIAAGKEPWKRGFEALRFGPYSNPGAWARPRGGEIEAGRFNATIGVDGRRAHDLALLWKLTDDPAYGDKARDFLVQNSNYTGTSWAGTGPLDNGKVHLLIEAAELMRDYPGWAAADQKKFGDMLRKVFYPHIMSGDIMRWGNQGLTAYTAVLAMAIFLDDAKMYDRVWNCVNDLPHRPDDVPYPAGGVWKPEWPANYGEFFIERTKPPAFGTEEDFGYDDRLKYYIYRNGQTQEACRDQAHATYGLFKMVSIAEMFWNQGDDLYSALDNRILSGIEWTLRYNLSDWEPKAYTDKEEEATFENETFYRARSRNNRWTALKQSNHARGSDGGPAAPKVAALMRYAVCLGVPKAKTTWLREAVKRQHANKGVEIWGVGPNWYYEWEGWGTLTKMRSSHQVGDPGTWKNGARVSGAHVVPGLIRAVDWDFDAAPRKGRETAHYPTGGAVPASDYRTDATVPVVKVGQKFVLTRLRKGEWCDYTLNVKEAGRYKVVVYQRHAGRLAVSVTIDGGQEVTGRFGKQQRTSRSEVGVVNLAPGAPVLRLTIEDAQSAEITAIGLEKL